MKKLLSDSDFRADQLLEPGKQSIDWFRMGGWRWISLHDNKRKSEHFIYLLKLIDLVCFQVLIIALRFFSY